MGRKSQIQQLINKHLPESVKPLEDVPDMDVLRMAIRDRIRYLLDTDLERLLHMLYRIDVREEIVRNILAIEEPGNIDNALTDAILLRIEEKIRLREKYRDS